MRLKATNKFLLPLPAENADRDKTNACFFRRAVLLRGAHGVGEDGREWLDQGVVGRISILLLVYPRQRGSYRATTMSPVMSTVRHCPLLPGESIFAWSRAESGNYVAASLNDATAIGLLFQDLTSSAHSCDSYPVIPSLRCFNLYTRRRISRNLHYLHLSQI